MTPLLEVTDLSAGYGDVSVLDGVSLHVDSGEVVAVVGANGAGKTTLLSAICGLVPPSSGQVVVEDRDLTRWTADACVGEGLVMVPEGRRLFPYLSVHENLLLGAFHRRNRRGHQAVLDEVFELFPQLADRREQLAGSLSGGEQQMCAIGRGLMARPRVLMLDEPSLGLAPIIVDKVFAAIREFASRGVTVLLVEQNLSEALEMSSRAYVLEKGSVVLEGAAADLRDNEEVKATYLGM